MAKYSKAPMIFRMVFAVLVFSVLITLLNMIGIQNPFYNPFSRPAAEPKPVTPPPGDLGGDEQATIEIFKRLSPSVVYITSASVMRNRFNLNIFEVPQGSGTGFIWDHDGHIVTNNHVIADADNIHVNITNGNTWLAHIVGTDPEHDIAVIRIGAPKNLLQPVIIGESDSLQVGQKVLAIGNPFGLDSTLTTGIISALGRTIPAMTGYTLDGMIQTDASINPGNSGGPLLDSFGRVIGVNTAIISPSGVSAGLGFAVPIKTVNRIVPQLITNGKVERPYLGVSVIPDTIARQWRVQGAIIRDVIPGSPADTAELQGIHQRGGEILLGDIIVKVQDRTITGYDDLVDTLGKHEPGERITLEILRDEKIISVNITLGAQ